MSKVGTEQPNHHIQIISVTVRDAFEIVVVVYTKASETARRLA